VEVSCASGTWTNYRYAPPRGMMGGVTQHAYELPAVEGGELGRLADEAAGGEVVYLTRGGRRVAAIVPVAAGAAGMAALEAFEDAEDERAAAEALAEWEADGFRTVPAEQVWAETDA
jgi:antitoxin (DNA-binding transcriptional repressor) of toxin-antitoxin stability system